MSSCGKNENPQEMNRRKFLKVFGGGAVASSAALYGCAPKNEPGAAVALGEVPTDKMTYRQHPTNGDKVSILGYGCMRWPLKQGSDGKDQIDQEAVNRLVDYAIEHGVNYFDTSPVYVQGMSEKATGIALARHPRNSYYLATKLSNFQNYTRENSLAMYRQSFRDLQTDYLDYYLLHSIGGGNGIELFNDRYINNGMLDFLVKEREAGRIRNLGWSFHGDVKVFDYVLDMGVKWDFVQIQLNYLDWKHASGRNVNADYLYGELEKRGIPAVIMEPLLGGRLSNVPDHIVARLKQQRPENSVASWAFRFAGSPDGVLTVLSGMTYMEHLQDIISWFASKRKKYRFSYSPALKWVRYGTLVIFILACIAGIGSLVALISPYSAYGRIASNLFAPIYQEGNNLLAYFAERMDSYAFYSVDVWVRSLATMGIAILSFVILAILAWRNGRTYCNTICPVGTVLGFLSKYALLKPRIDTDKCNGCGLCARKCKASCIDSKNHAVDYSRCVTCMDCLDNCRQGAISYTRARKADKVTSVKESLTKDTTDVSRRRALSATALVAMSSVLHAQQKKLEDYVEMKKDGGFAPIKERKEPNRLAPLVPPGALSIGNLAQHCTGCQLCVSVCENHVLRPSTDLMKLMQPKMAFDRGYCRPECVKCSEVCPTGAIKPITKEDKSAIQIGHAVWVRDLCIVNTDGMSCGNCERHCPTKSIQMVAKDPADPKSLKIPVINTETCIGCGACEYLCPSRPYSAIYVEGHEMHRSI